MVKIALRLSRKYRGEATPPGRESLSERAEHPQRFEKIRRSRKQPINRYNMAIKRLSELILGKVFSFFFAFKKEQKSLLFHLIRLMFFLPPAANHCR